MARSGDLINFRKGIWFIYKIFTDIKIRQTFYNIMQIICITVELYQAIKQSSFYSFYLLIFYYSCPFLINLFWPIFCVQNLKDQDLEPVASSMFPKTYRCLAPMALPNQPTVGPTYNSPKRFFKCPSPFPKMFFFYFHIHFIFTPFCLDFTRFCCAEDNLG